MERRSLLKMLAELPLVGWLACSTIFRVPKWNTSIEAVQIEGGRRFGRDEVAFKMLERHDMAVRHGDVITIPTTGSYIIGANISSEDREVVIPFHLLRSRPNPGPIHVELKLDCSAFKAELECVMKRVRRLVG